MSDLHVLFRIGTAEYAIDAADVAQMEAYAGATPVPGAAPHVAGIVQVRGRVVPVVDVRVRFGLERIEPTPDSRVVVARLDERVIGLLVDQAREVVRLPAERITPPPPMVAAQSRGLVRAVAHHAGRLVMLVDVRKLVGEEHADGH